MTARRARLDAFVVAVACAGVLTCVLTTAAHGFDRAARRPGEFWVLTALVLLGELRPLSYRGAGRSRSIVTSGAFAFALLVSFGTAPAVVVLGAASLIADVAKSKSWQKIAFNFGQFTLAMGATGLVHRLLTGPVSPLSTSLSGLRDLLAVLPAAAAFCLVNDVCVGTVIAIDHGTRVRREVASTISSDWWTSWVLVSVGPAIALIADHAMAFLPLLILPVAATLRVAQVSSANEHMAWHDPLTDLPNRPAFTARLREALTEARHRDDPVTVLLIDLDRFKEVNDTLGHHIGDLLLCEIGPRLHDASPDADLIARLGGDEFAVLLTDVRSTRDAVTAARRVVDALEQPFFVESFRLSVEASIGIAVFPEHATTPEELLQRADVAMYVAKEHHTGAELYRPEQDHHSVRRLGLLGELRDALQDGRLVLHYQPKIALADDSVVGVEALLRWDHLDDGLVSPDEFVPLAERSGLIQPLTRSVLRSAITQAKAWRLEGLDIPISVNLSVRNLADLALPGEILRLLQKHDVPPAALEIEVTESTLMADPERVRHVLATLAALGLRIAVDDFGTGYSSLAYLQRLPVSELKIDRSFVAHLATNENDLAIVRATVDLARNLGVRVVAEGVEDDESLRLLADMGCWAAQGYRISTSLPPAELADWVRRRSGVPPTGARHLRALPDTAAPDAS